MAVSPWARMAACLLHENDHFASVTVNGVSLSPGTYSFSQLNSTYPANFPASWTQQNGSTITTGSGQIIVGNGAPSSPHITGIQVSGTSLSIFRHERHGGWFVDVIAEHQPRAAVESMADKLDG